MSQAEHFARLAPSYDELRPPPAEVGPLDAAIVDAGRLAGARVLDIGCGTGRGLRVLAIHYGCEVAGVDASEAMLARARAKLPDADLRLGVAEALPFPDASFTAATMVSVAHHVDRTRAFPEARRVLAPGGRLVVANLDPDGLDRWWVGRFFPSSVTLERRRMPTLDGLVAELEAAGFADVGGRRLPTNRVFARDEALAKIRGRAYSTFDLLGEEEYAEGLARAERELPERVEYVLGSLIVVGRR